jgi:5,10-methylene-tetrahydrofolate dehydrogenase/methenyl tetrahydrofolate cyclohydrolase
VQLPLPAHLQPQEQTLLHAIAPAKDVDGLHPTHFFHLPRRDQPDHVRLEPCTPAGCLELLTRNGIDVAGKDVVVVGRGQLVGLPLSLMLLARNATVTTCHSHTKALAEKVQRADIVVVATGMPELIKGAWLKPGVVVVDVGVNYVDDASAAKGYKILGDVEYAAASAVASAITPVPGGIGPMTIAMLIKNTVASAKNHSQ